MAYSQNPVTVERMLSYLKPLVDGQECIWRTAPNKSRWLAYRIREALAVAREFPERFPELARSRYRIEVLSSQEVRARFSAAPEIEVGVYSEEIPRSARVQTEETRTAQQIMDDWFENPKREKMYFPNADLDDHELVALYKWATDEAQVLMFENAGALTLLPLEGNEDTADYAWTPEDL